jgi:hypothetical protein
MVVLYICDMSQHNSNPICQYELPLLLHMDKHVTHIRVMVNFSIIGREKDRRMKNNNSHIIIIF